MATATATFDTIYLSKDQYHEVVEEKPSFFCGRFRAYLFIIMLLGSFLRMVPSVSLPSSITILFTIPWFVDCYTIQLKYYTSESAIAFISYVMFGG